MSRSFMTTWLAAAWIAVWCAASPTMAADESSDESTSALSRIAAEVQAMRQQLAETTQQLDAARSEIEQLRKQLADEGRAARFEQWRQARKDAEAERIALNREAARLETTREDYLKTAHVEAERFEQMHARVERDQQRQPEELEGLRRPLRQVARNNLEPTAPLAGPAYYDGYGYDYGYYYGAYPYYYYPRSYYFYPYYGYGGHGGFHSIRDSAAYPYSHIHGSRIYPWARSPFISGGGGHGHHSHSSSGLNLKLNFDSGNLKLNIGGGQSVRSSRW